jgi:hypothetical protein
MPNADRARAEVAVKNFMLMSSIEFEM